MLSDLRLLCLLRGRLREVLRPLRLLLSEEEEEEEEEEEAEAEVVRDVRFAAWSTSFSRRDSRRTLRLRGLIESTKDRMLIFVAGESVFAVRKLIAKLGGTPAGRPPDDDEADR